MWCGRFRVKGLYPLPQNCLHTFQQATRSGSGQRRFLSFLSLLIHRSDRCVQVVVRDNNVDQALKALKKKLQREGVFREMKLRRHFEKPSERRAREAAEAVRRARKVERKRLEREGF
jgi:small subunit ribosomal protein S21